MGVAGFVTERVRQRRRAIDEVVAERRRVAECILLRLDHPREGVVDHRSARVSQWIEDLGNLVLGVVDVLGDPTLRVRVRDQVSRTVVGVAPGASHGGERIGDRRKPIGGVVAQREHPPRRVRQRREATRAVVPADNRVAVAVGDGRELPGRVELVADLVLAGECQAAVRVLRQLVRDPGLRREAAVSVGRVGLAVAVLEEHRHRGRGSPDPLHVERVGPAVAERSPREVGILRVVGPGKDQVEAGGTGDSQILRRLVEAPGGEVHRIVGERRAVLGRARGRPGDLHAEDPGRARRVTVRDFQTRRVGSRGGVGVVHPPGVGAARSIAGAGGVRTVAEVPDIGGDRAAGFAARGAARIEGGGATGDRQRVRKCDLGRGSRLQHLDRVAAGRPAVDPEVIGARRPRREADLVYHLPGARALLVGAAGALRRNRGDAGLRCRAEEIRVARSGGHANRVTRAGNHVDRVRLQRPRTHVAERGLPVGEHGDEYE